jgi:hypothetical protein
MDEPPLDSQTVQILLSEYQTNLELWKHDDSLRQQRYGTFLSINSLLLVALGGWVTLAPSTLNAVVVAMLIALFGFPVCLMWHRVQLRNAEYIRFRRYQLRSIESRLKPMSTFTNQWLALNKFETVHFANIDDLFTIRPQAKASSTLIEGRLPLVLVFFWSAVFIGSIAVVVLKALQYIP